METLKVNRAKNMHTSLGKSPDLKEKVKLVEVQHMQFKQNIALYKKRTQILHENIFTLSKMYFLWKSRRKTWKHHLPTASSAYCIHCILTFLDTFTGISNALLMILCHNLILPHRQQFSPKCIKQNHLVLYSVISRRQGLQGQNHKKWTGETKKQKSFR